MAQNDNKIISLKDHLASVEGAKHEQFTSRAETAVKEPTAFEAMRQHILKHYQGVQAEHSFMDGNGSIFDCIPIEQQPGLRGKQLAKAPGDLPKAEAKETKGEKTGYVAKEIEAPFGPGKKDSLGNAMECPDGTIPMRRLKLEDMSRFENLQKFFRKGPSGHDMIPPQAAQPADSLANHRWAHAFQNVSNLGGHSFINIWDPAIGKNQAFSLSQHWYSGPSSAGVQTAEVGLQVYPAFYGNTKPVFFIYWTADGYNKTGCYNLSCSNFVQTNKSWGIGGTVGPISATGGQQWELEIAYYHVGGNWWLYVKGTAGSNQIGYYPGSQYGSGTMATHATEVDYGGECDGTGSWAGMGSGAFANQGWQKACYQRDIIYYPTAGGAVNASLTPSQATPQCFTVTVNSYAAPWSETIFYGGPGGTKC
jgi:hypothetical protein